MKKTLLLSLVALFSLSLMAQNRVQVPKNLRNISVKKPVHASVEYQQTQNQSPVELNRSKAINTEEIGQSQVYDLQSNSSVDHRIYLFPDGTVGTTYTLGNSAGPSYADRGTGYNYYDGTAWGTMPTARVESVRCGWGSYSHLGTSNEGEIIVAHTTTANGMRMSKRAVKGTGAWVQTNIPIPVGSVAANSAIWPRVATSGNNIHIICAGDTSSTTATGFNGQHNPLFYYRSTDGGTTWDKAGVPFPGLDNSFCHEGFGGDIYSWAEPQGNTLAFVIGDNWTDLTLMKSIDNGDTWTKTVIYQHPYPCWTDAVVTMLPDGVTPDTPYVCDGAHAVELDASGKAHVVFGLMRVLNDVAGDGSSSYFPGIDGIGYWNEGDAAITSMNPDDLYAAEKLIAWCQDMDGSGVLFDGYTAGENWPLYYLSLSSMPQLTIDGNNIYLVYKSVVENMQSPAGQFYSHVWGRKSKDGGQSWCDMVELTAGGDYAQIECVFPTLSKTTANNLLHVTFQQDFEPGLSVRGDLDAAGSNSIMYLTLDASSDLTCLFSTVNEVNLSGNVSVYPNPTSENMNITLFNNKSTDVTMTVLNMVGGTVMTEKFVAERGASKQVNIKELPVGIYLAKFETASGTFTQKIIKN